MFRSSRTLPVLFRISTAALLAVGCQPAEPACADCDAVVVAAVGEPSTLVPPVVDLAVGRDIGDLVYERLAVLAPGKSPLDTLGYLPGLATAWSRPDSLTWRFKLRDGAHWSDGKPVTAADVVFSFEAYGDSVLDAAPRQYLAGRVTVTADDPRTVRMTFAEASPEQLFDATQQVRILPKHVWESIPRAAWAADTSVAHLVGSGPYRVVEWKRGEFVRLVADSTREGVPPLRRVVWRFATDPDAALQMVLAHEADLLESVGSPARVQRVLADSALRAVRYPSAVYGFLAYHVSVQGAAHQVLGDRRVRQALGFAVDRAAIATSLFGPGTRVPDGPVSQVLWLSDTSKATPARDSAAAATLLDEAGWLPGKDGVRARGGKKLAVDVLVPATSASRRDLAQALLAAWRAIGVQGTITAVDFPQFQERLRTGKFDTYIGAYLDEPTPRSLADQWSSSGIGALNHGEYRSAAFDTLLAKASKVRGQESARRAWRTALDTLVADAPALFLYAPVNVAAVSRRLEGVQIDPWSWLSGLPRWTKVPAATAVGAAR